MLKCQNYFYHNFLAKYWFSIIFSPIGVTFFSLSIPSVYKLCGFVMNFYEVKIFLIKLTWIEYELDLIY
jgi:hypothetical protein